MSSRIERVGVVGCGLMGSGIAEVCARAGLDVLVREIDEAALAIGRRRIGDSLARAVHAGKLSGVHRDQVVERIGFTTDLGDFADRQVVVEAVVESESEKEQVFSILDKVIDDPDSEAVIGMHFFNPVPILGLVELVPSLLTGAETITTAEQFAATTLGKRVIRSQDRAGFVVNALLVPYILSAVRMLESGFATASDIDTGMVEGCAHPMGPLALADLIGLDTLAAVAESLYEEFKEPLHAAPPLLSRMVEAGLLGRKAGRGFYEYKR
jgi:3-hydroxybutyryl-CoA dehydrogenase